MTSHLSPRQPVQRPKPEIEDKPEPEPPPMAQCPACDNVFAVTGIAPILGPGGRFVFHVKCPRCHQMFGHIENG